MNLDGTGDDAARDRIGVNQSHVFVSFVPSWCKITGRDEGFVKGRGGVPTEGPRSLQRSIISPRRHEVHEGSSSGEASERTNRDRAPPRRPWTNLRLPRKSPPPSNGPLRHGRNRLDFQNECVIDNDVGYQVAVDRFAFVKDRKSLLAGEGDVRPDSSRQRQAT